MKLISENTESTVVLRYEHKQSQRIAYQSEAQLEDALIEQLQRQGYEYLPIHTEEELIANLRVQLEKLNHITFTDNEWKGFFRTKIANTGASVADKTELLQDDRTAQLQYIKEDNSGFQNVKLIDKTHIFENSLQVIHQYTPTEGKHKTRYDVTILVNGLPMVHVELKRRGVQIREAFNQIKRYANDSFWADSGLFEYIQLFVISNGSDTKYYSNTTRDKAQVENRKKTNKATGEQLLKSSKRSDSFEFTSYWADSENNVLRDLDDFTVTFFAKHTLLNILTRYCVFTADRELMVMRPYQISATEAILRQILISTNKRQLGTIDAGGYIWHTTGSGKTLTSFKTAQLCTQLDYVDKVLFVVDRKDLDIQTIREYERFKKGCVSSNKSTAILTKQLGNNADRIIITTIQKLNTFCKKEKEHSVYGRHVVIIFDECHRSQFGDMHDMITKRFKRYHIFGFTGTPIFPENAVNRYYTTESIFGRRLHTYTVISAIADNNVKPFRVEYIKTVDSKSGILDQQVRDIDRERALLAPQRIHNIVEYVLQHFDMKTYRNQVYTLKDKRVSGFNSLFATASIEAARLYYAEFKKQQENLPEEKRLKIALIYSYGANDDDLEGGLLAEEDSDSLAQLEQSDRDFLENAIKDYNQMFGSNYDGSSDNFANYYKDVSSKMKKRELDMLIVVNMFLTGFDAPTLNTLWVDKNLRQHGLMQAFSRTNRILNRIKQFGMIVCFRNLEQATNDAIAMFGDKDANGIVLLKTYDEYIHGFVDEKGEYHMGFADLVEALKERFPLDNPQALHMMGEEAEKDFIRVFGTYLRMNNLLSTFDRYEDEKDSFITPAEEQDYRSFYLDLRDQYRGLTDGDKVDINDDLVFEIELIKQVDINIDYIIAIIEKHRAKKDKDKTELMVQIQKAIGASPMLRNKKDLIEEFVRRYAMDREVSQQWAKYVEEQAHRQLDALIKEEELVPDATIDFMRHSFQIGEVERNGDRITKCLKPLSLFDNSRAANKKHVLDRLCEWFDRFFDIFKFE